MSVFFPRNITTFKKSIFYSFKLCFLFLFETLVGVAFLNRRPRINDYTFFNKFPKLSRRCRKWIKYLVYVARGLNHCEFISSCYYIYLYRFTQYVMNNVIIVYMCYLFTGTACKLKDHTVTTKNFTQWDKPLYYCAFH